MKDRIISRLLRGNEKNIQRDCFVWNTIAGVFNAAQAVVMMAIITRTDGLAFSGILSIAFAVGNLLMTIGKYGVRNYQVTDIKGEYSLNSYLTMRILTVLGMMGVSLGYTIMKYFHGSYSFYKAGVVLVICSIYMVESFEDVFLGYYQGKGRLDIASKVFIIRWFLIMLIFALSAFGGMGLLKSAMCALIVSVLVEIYLIVNVNKMLNIPSLKIESKFIKEMLKKFTALFLAAFLTYYVTNAPKYAIDRFLTEDMQAYFGYISMPVFVVELLNCFLYQPQMVLLARDWEKRDCMSFNKKIIKQSIIILILTIVCVVSADVVGIPILTLIYGVDLRAFKKELLVLMFAGGALAFVGYASVLLTIMRKQNLLLINMMIIGVGALIGFGRVVSNYGMMGAIYYYLFLMFMLAILNYWCTIMTELKLSRKNKKKGDYL